MPAAGSGGGIGARRLCPSSRFLFWPHPPGAAAFVRRPSSFVARFGQDVDAALPESAWALQFPSPNVDGGFGRALARDLPARVLQLVIFVFGWLSVQFSEMIVVVVVAIRVVSSQVMGSAQAVVIDLTEYGIKRLKAMSFLNGFREPSLLILHEPELTWGAFVRYFSRRLAVVAVVVMDDVVLITFRRATLKLVVSHASRPHASSLPSRSTSTPASIS